jgi:probable addiction module antidote protein
MKDRSHDDSMAELLREDPSLTVAYLNEILENGDQGELLVALRQLAQALGGVTSIAAKSDLNPTQIYRTLSEGGNPELRSLTAILRAMNLQLRVESARNLQSARIKRQQTG